VRDIPILPWVDPNSNFNRGGPGPALGEPSERVLSSRQLRVQLGQRLVIEPRPECGGGFESGESSRIAASTGEGSIDIA
jgi:hypothetical protein